VHRPSLGTPLLCVDDPHIIALACDAAPGEAVPVPQLPLNEVAAVAEFVQRWLGGLG
jgi:molybdopterin-guanine dinucleotide biosynthesis protein B